MGILIWQWVDFSKKYHKVRKYASGDAPSGGARPYRTPGHTRDKMPAGAAPGCGRGAQTAEGGVAACTRLRSFSTKSGSAGAGSGVTWRRVSPITACGATVVPNRRVATAAIWACWPANVPPPAIVADVPTHCATETRFLQKTRSLWRKFAVQ